MQSRVKKLAQGLTRQHRIQTWVLLVEGPKRRGRGMGEGEGRE